MSKSIREVIKSAQSSQRALATLAKLGVVVEFEKHLDRVSNVSYCWGGHMKDGKLHYTSRYNVKGKTYGIKDLLSKWGLKWCRQSDCWFIEAKRGVDAGKIAQRILKVTSKRGMAI